jgi:hypothetical protein
MTDIERDPHTNYPCDECHEALHTWVTDSGKKYCDACYYYLSAPFSVRRGTSEYDFTVGKDKSKLAKVEWEVVNKETGMVEGSRTQLIAAYSLWGLLCAQAGHSIGDDA